MQWKVTVAPIGTVWSAGPSIILAAMQIKIEAENSTHAEKQHTHAHKNKRQLL